MNWDKMFKDGTFIHGDCMDYMKQMPDNIADLAIVDPPYGINITSMNMGGRQTVKPDNTKSWDNCMPSSNYFIELKRISLNQIIWGGNYFNLPPSRCWLIWDKGETLYGRDFAEGEMAWTSFNKVVRLYKKSPNQLDRIHPTQKPTKLYKWILHNYAKPDMKIIDTHVGSGSSIIAFLDFGCEWIGFEIDKDYHKAATKRIETHKAQLKLF